MTDIIKEPCDPMIGADIEGFLYDDLKAGYISAIGEIGGTKEDPEPMKGLPKGFAVQEDNVMAEFNIPPARTPKLFAAYIKKAKMYMIKLVGDDRQIHYTPDVLFRAEQLDSPAAQTIGCDPDFNAYEGGTQRHALPTMDNWRGAGGHIHLGGNFQCPDFVAALFADLCLGLALGITGSEMNRRSKWYGQPGIYRPKPYGIEWRSPSSAWVSSRGLSSYVGESGIRLATWLTNTDARDLQASFRAVDWAQVQRYMQFSDKLKNPRNREREIIIMKARKAGVPL